MGRESSRSDGWGGSEQGVSRSSEDKMSFPHIEWLGSPDLHLLAISPMVLRWLDHTSVGCCSKFPFLLLSLLTAGQTAKPPFSNVTPFARVPFAPSFRKVSHLCSLFKCCLSLKAIHTSPLAGPLTTPARLPFTIAPSPTPDCHSCGWHHPCINMLLLELS